MHYGCIIANGEWSNGAGFIISLLILTETNEDVMREKELEVLEVDKSQEERTLEVKANENKQVANSIKGAQLFLVKGNSDVRQYLSQVLSQYFDVQTFNNEKDSADTPEEQWPELLVSDVLMPEMNACEHCKYIKSNIKTSHVPVILLAVCASVDDRIQAAGNGADAFVTKSLILQHSVTSIEALLKGRSPLRERVNLKIPFSRKRKGTSDSLFLEKLYKELAKNLDNQELDVDQLACALYMNRTYFYQKVKALTNHTPYELLKEYRIAKAAELLSDERISVNDAFVMTGFKSRTHFTKLFKEKYKVTPGKYLKNK